MFNAVGSMFEVQAALFSSAADKTQQSRVSKRAVSWVIGPVTRPGFTIANVYLQGLTPFNDPRADLAETI